MNEDVLQGTTETREDSHHSSTNNKNKPDP